MMPLVAPTSVCVMRLVRLRPSVMTSAPDTESTLKMPPASGEMALPRGTLARGTRVLSTWYCSTLVSSGVSASNWARVMPSSVASALKASSVGANTVKLPEPSSVARRPVFTSAWFSVPKRVSVAVTSAIVNGWSSPPPHAATRPVARAAMEGRIHFNTVCLLRGHAEWDGDAEYELNGIPSELLGHSRNSIAQ